MKNSMMQFRWVVSLVLVALALCWFPGGAACAGRGVLLATTTSLQDSGLLEELIPRFEKQSGYIVKTIAIGSGEALRMGRKGEVDLLLVHSPAAVKRFVEDGFGVDGRELMHNEFVVVGPASDPAGVRDCHSGVEAFTRIAAGRSPFFSRQDNSGTHSREMELWKSAGIHPVGQPWYQRTTGLGMGQTLFMADERKGYTLSDRATYLALRGKLELVILLQGDPGLRNGYQLVLVNPARWPRVSGAAARAFADFLRSPATRNLIAEFGRERFGEPLFAVDDGGVGGKGE